MSTSHEIRQQFINFFRERCEHAFVPSSPVVPHDDPTLLFANAGMNQFKPYFLGTEKPEHTRVANTQKCIRAGGKHNDLDDVGKDTYHHTFFEMLGNWSFGDYFKKEAIDWAWELLTEVWKLDPERLHATYFEGDIEEGLEPDTEAQELWLRYLPAERVHPGNKKDNFWEMGETGPCGPCSEVHYDGTPDKNGGSKVNADDPDVIEIWNLVFIQFNRTMAGLLEPLPAKHVDTGMGFERIVRVLQGKNSNYDTDVFTPLFEAIQKVTGTRAYTSKLKDPTDTAYRVIADHIRTLTFALTDGAVPSNDGRGYVLRRILRRAVLQGWQTLNVKEPFFNKLVPAVVEAFGDVFPELRDDPDRVAKLIREEEESFIRTIDRGIALFEDAADKAKNKQIHADDAFTLYDTYGFPLDLTQIMAEQRGMTVDVEGFHRLMNEARERSRAAKGGGDTRGQLVELTQKHAPGETTFTGYDGPSWQGETSLALYTLDNDSYQPADKAHEGESVVVVLGTSPFYAEAGGQVGDVGTITTDTGTLAITDTLKIGQTTFHLGHIKTGTINSSTQNIQAQVDADRLDRIRANHTTTHVMNRALRCCVYDKADQRGSLVDEEKLRFDFTCDKALTPEQVEQVEQQVNADIDADLPVHWQVADQQAALKISGLRAVFGEKYPPKVRIVSIGEAPSTMLDDPENERWKSLSIEFCGGVHLKRTSEAQAFCIVSEEAVGKGVRRITALTGQRAKQAREEADMLLKRVKALGQAPAETLVHEIAEAQTAVDQATLPLTARQNLRSALQELTARLKEYDKAQGQKQQEVVVEHARSIAEANDGQVIVAEVPDADATSLRTAMDVVRKRHENAAILLGSAAEGKVALVASVPKDLIQKGLKAGDWVKHTANVVGGGGGGKPDMAQAGGKDPDKLPDALDAAKTFAQSKL